GRLDPKTGQIKEYPLKTPNSGPHGLVADQEGNIWFTANYKGYIGKLNPKTGEATEYLMPDPNAGDPHTLIFDQNGILWFTVQRGNFLGRLDAKTGTVKLKQSPTPDSRPYGIVVDSKGIPFFCELGTNKIGSINPDSIEITEYLLPEGARPRRLDITPDDMVYYTDYSRGYLGRLDPKTGKVEEWASPGGSQSRPYGIAATKDGMVWYSESGVTPNTIVRFNPKTQSFSNWPIPSGGGVVRHIVATPEGNLYLACSGVNKVAIVEVKQ
ncbi:MAG: virginiamycin B lyase family protein, partial [Thermodesulfobacteriota bacterium]